MKKQVKFYGDTSTEKNKKFTFRVSTYNDALACLKRFAAKGVVIRAAWYNVLSDGKSQVKNQRIDAGEWQATQKRSI